MHCSPAASVSLSPEGQVVHPHLLCWGFRAQEYETENKISTSTSVPYALEPKQKGQKSGVRASSQLPSKVAQTNKTESS